MYKISIYFLRELVNLLDAIEKALKGELKTSAKLLILKRIKKAKKTINLFIGE